MSIPASTAPPRVSPPRKKPFYRGLSFEVVLAVAAAIVLGYVSPATAVAMKPLGDAFIRLITMIITLVIFCTLVTGIAGMEDMKKVGRVGGKALLYFEVVSTLALLIGLVVGNLVHPGSGFNVNPATLDPKAVAEYAGQAKAQSVTDFLIHIIPTTVFDAFAKGDILQVLLVSLLFGFALSLAGSRGKPLVDFLDTLTRIVFGVVALLMRFAPLGAFGAMAFTIGKYGLASLGPLAKLMATLYITALFFVVVVLDRKSTRLNSSHEWISYAVFCLKKKNRISQRQRDEMFSLGLDFHESDIIALVGFDKFCGVAGLIAEHHFDGLGAFDNVKVGKDT